MNKIINRTKKHIENQKKKYIFLICIIIIGILSGLIFIFFLTSEDKLLINKELTLMINNICNHKINYFKTLINSLSNNILSIIGIYILGISIIGIPIIILFLFIKGFIFGFSISSIINIYHIKGFMIMISYLFPSHFLLLIVLLLMGFHAINFSIRLFRYLFLKENVSLLIYFKKLNKISIISLIVVIICSLIETLLTPFLIDLFI